MTVLEQAERFRANLLKLGTKRLIALGVTGFVVFAITGLAGYFLSRPSLEVLYSNLDHQDAGRIASALKEANISFDVSSDGGTVLVRYGESSAVRMLLAEKGLPSNPSAGNELFDKLGSLGLTSFMQEVTRVRALEGELARTIQTMRGVRAARVHLVMPDEGSFRRQSQPPSASVVVRTDSSNDGAIARAVRHLVAAAVPGMKLEEVTILNTEGALLASGDDLADAAPGQMLSLESSVSKEIQENIRKTLTPYLGLPNFQISVAARINTDKKQTNETIFNPDSRVERSVKVTKQNQTSQNSSSEPPTTVSQNLPQEKTNPSDGKQSNEENQKREELTNYEVSSKSINTISGGFSVEHVSVAVLINKAALAAALGGKPSPEAIDKQLADLQDVVASAAGLNKERGDVVKISAVDFVDSGHDLEPIPEPGLSTLLMRQTGPIVNGVVILVVALSLIWFGVRPAMKIFLGESSSGAELVSAGAPPLLSTDDFEGPQPFVPTFDAMGQFQTTSSEPSLIEDLTDQSKRTPLKRLEQIVEYDEQQAASILKLWLRQGEAA
jgi:flagellar M-ring protein FliF